MTIANESMASSDEHCVAANTALSGRKRQAYVEIIEPTHICPMPLNPGGG